MDAAGRAIYGDKAEASIPRIKYGAGYVQNIRSFNFDTGSKYFLHILNNSQPESIKPDLNILVPSIFENRLSLLIIVLICSGIIFSAGTTTLPMDAHEVFVVQTTQEMHDRGNWLVPWFNDQPRLKKPPLNYWLTGAAAWLSRSLDNIQPWHGRVISVMAGLAMLSLIYLLGLRLYNGRIATLSVLVLATSLGLFTYSHDARPDMLYAFLCTAGYVAFTLALYSQKNFNKKILIYVMWAAYGLATLSKGPHMPAIYLLASLMFCFIRRMSWHEIINLIKPVTGLILFSLLTVPWWYNLNLELGGARLHETQLSGSLFAINFFNLFNFYYFYRPLLLLLPWAIFLPYTVKHIMSEKQYAGGNQLLLLYLLLPVLVLSIGNQQRWFYMLPSIVPAGLLLAAGVNIFIADLKQRFNLVLISTLVLGIAFAIAGYTHTGWSKDRFEYYNLAIRAHDLAKNDPVIIIGVNPDIYVYYTGVGIKQIKNPDEIVDLFQTSIHNRVYAIINYRNIESLPGSLNYTILHKTASLDSKSIALIMLERKT
ncbi:MAG: hypothetical protein A2W76_03250 [Gammaproteobacteria bacterium RIFCSPLOWO2_12_47_11]|nr:MAG: hypothetical protein A2W76_03250 [Gammaproteobacteria bacterium RIFCSPLOWO2_12_47_11]